MTVDGRAEYQKLNLTNREEDFLIINVLDKTLIEIWIY